jgi:phage recombination protein Bet
MPQGQPLATKPPQQPAAGAVVLNEENSVLIRLGQQFGVVPSKLLDIVMNTLIPHDAKVSTTPEHVMAFLLVAEKYGLDPFTKQIYAFPAKGGGIQAVVGVDGWYFLMNTHPQFAGLEFTDHADVNDPSKLVAITARIFRKDRPDHPTEVTEYMVECMRDIDTWRKWPRRMLRHKAAIQCARIAFSLSGIVDPDEAERFIEARGSKVTRVQGGMGGLKTALAAPAVEALPVEEQEREPGDDEPEEPAGVGGAA